MRSESVRLLKQRPGVASSRAVLIGIRLHPFGLLYRFFGEVLPNAVLQTGEADRSIAYQLRSTVDDILEYNELEDPNAIYPGQLLLVRVNLVTPEPTEEGADEGPANTPGSISTLTPTP